MICEGGVSVFYSHSLELLFLSYQNGTGTSLHVYIIRRDVNPSVPVYSVHYTGGVLTLVIIPYPVI